MKTIENLHIFWLKSTDLVASRIGSGHVDADGLLFHGYWKKGVPEEVTSELNKFQAIWSYAEVELEAPKPHPYDFTIAVHIIEWPYEKEWLNCIERSLRWFLDRGAKVSWCGTEYGNPSPEIFEPGNTDNYVYAACSESTGFICNAGLKDEYADLTHEQLLQFKAVMGAGSV